MAAAKKSATAVAKKSSTALVTWEEELAKYADSATEQEASVGVSNFISFRAGQISYQGNKFKDNQLDVVVVDAICENALYAEVDKKGLVKFSKFDADNLVSPICYSFGREPKDMVPHEKSSYPQSETCATCRWNEFETAENGSGKACKNIRRLAMLPAKPVSVELLTSTEMALAKIPVTSVKPWAAYVRTLKALVSKPPFAVITQLSATPDDKTQFKLKFEHVADLPRELVEAVMRRRKEAEDSLLSPYPENKESEKEAAPAKKRKY